MIALSEYLRNHGYSADVHTRIPGIWEKLGRLYNLDLIDERENQLDFGEDESGEDKFLEFSLPEDEFGEMMWIRGQVASEAVSSPPQIHAPPPDLPAPKKRKRGEAASRASTVEDTDEAQTSPPPSSATRPGRGRGGRRGGGRGRGRGRESSERQASKETTAEPTDQEELEETGDEGDEEEAETAEETTEEKDGSPSPRPTRGRGKGSRGGGTARGQGKSRRGRKRGK